MNINGGEMSFCKNKNKKRYKDVLEEICEEDEWTEKWMENGFCVWFGSHYQLIICGYDLTFDWWNEMETKRRLGDYYFDVDSLV